MLGCKAWSVVAFIICFQSAIDAAGICGNATIRKHWSDCRKFVECGETSTVIFECPERSYFNSETLVCDFAMYAECIIDLEAEVQFFGQQRILESTPGVLVSIETCNQNPLGAKLPHPDYCNMFYQCSPSGPILFECPTNLLFCPKRHVCNWPQFVNCGDSGGGDVNATQCAVNCFPDKRCPLDCKPDLNTTVLPHPSMCDAFLRCIGGCACFEECPVDLYWSTNLGRCVERYRSECTEIERPECPAHNCTYHTQCPPEDDPNNPIRLPHPDRCDAYLKCHQGQACVVECPEGLEYNPETEVCDIAGDCIIGGTTVTAGTTREEDITTPDLTTPDITTPDITTPDITTADITTPDITTADITTPDITTADITTPDITTPDITTPDITTPDITTADITTPDITTADITTPDITTPDITTPDITTPDITTADITTPDITTPDITTPDITTADITTPDITTPDITTPEITTPDITTPDITTPDITTADITTPDITTPDITTPETTPITVPPPITTEPPPCPICPPGVCRPDDRCPIDPCQECNPVLLPNPDDCGMFYKCTHGYACEMHCPPGLHWSSAMNRCEWPKNGDCAAGAR